MRSEKIEPGTYSSEGRGTLDDRGTCSQLSGEMIYDEILLYIISLQVTLIGNTLCVYTFSLSRLIFYILLTTSFL